MYSEQNEHLKEENKIFVTKIDSLKQEMKALQNQIYKNKANKQLISNENTDNLIEKLQDILQILYHELQHDKDNFDDTKEISKAFKEWKQRERIKYQNMYTGNFDTNDESVEFERDLYHNYDIESTDCQQNSA